MQISDPSACKASQPEQGEMGCSVSKCHTLRVDKSGNIKKKKKRKREKKLLFFCCVKLDLKQRRLV